MSFKSVIDAVKGADIAKVIAPASTAAAGVTSGGGSTMGSTMGSTADSGLSSDVKTDLASVKPTVRYSRMTADDVRRYGIGMPDDEEDKGGPMSFKKGGKVKSIDGIALRGKTRAKLKGK